jgi:hypothetical protein
MTRGLAVLGAALGADVPGVVGRVADELRRAGADVRDVAAVSLGGGGGALHGFAARATPRTAAAH